MPVLGTHNWKIRDRDYNIPRFFFFFFYCHSLIILRLIIFEKFVLYFSHVTCDQDYNRCSKFYHKRPL